MTRVLYLTTGCFDKGGISRYNRYQITALREIFGEEAVTVFSLLAPDANAFETPFRVAWHGSGLSPWSKAAFSLRALLAGARRSFDYVLTGHVHLSALAFFAARLSGARMILNVYGLEIWSGMSLDSRWGLGRTDEIISDCHFTAQYLQSHNMANGIRPHVIWDCVDINRFTPGEPDESVLSRYGIPSPHTGINLLTLGRMIRDSLHKGYARLLDVFASLAHDLPALRLIYAGGGDLVDELKQAAADRGLRDRVFFTGSVHENDLPDIYRAAHIFSLVSDRGVGRGEGIPLTPLEAAACGVPILVGNQDGSQEAVSGNENGFIMDPFDPAAQAAAIRCLATNTSERQRMSDGARSRIVREFSYERFVRQHRTLMEDMH